ASAKQQQQRAVERERAKEALDHLETLLQHAHGADAALRSYLQAIEALDQCAQRVCAIADFPTRDHVRVGLQTTFRGVLGASRYRAVLEIPLLPPDQRQSLASRAERWAENVRHRLARCLAEPEAEKAA